MSMGWQCSECTFYNENADFLACEVCHNRRVPRGFRDHAATRSGSTWSYRAPPLDEVEHFVIPNNTVILEATLGSLGLGNGSALLLWGIDPAKLRTMKIPDSVKIIGPGAFRWCVALVSVEIPSSVDTIGVWAFEGCTALETVHFPDLSNIKCIPKYCFSRCSALRNVTIPSYIEVIGCGAFAGCHSLVIVAVPLASMKRRNAIGDNAFGRPMQSVLVLDLGTVLNTDEPNKYEAILGLHRYAKMLYKLPKDIGNCIVELQWPSSSRPSIPGPATLVDGAGIVQPLMLQTLAGDEYAVRGCWGKPPAAHPDFKRLAAEQHPSALGEVGSWDVLLHNTDVATHTLDLVALGNMLVRGEFDLEEPVLIVWTKLEQDEAPHSEVNRTAARAAPTDVPQESEHREYKRARVEA